MIRAENISKCYRIYAHPSDRLKEILTLGRRQHHAEFWAVRDVSLEVPPGCCLGIIGENGSGKSTLLRIIAGIAAPTTGILNVKGRVSALLELGAGFNPDFTGRENIFLNAAILGFTDKETKARIPAIEKFADIGEFIDRPVKTYSSGMFVRLAFAVAVHVDPDVLVVDEALSVGDFFFQQRCMRRIHQLKHQGVTIVFVSHDLNAIRGLADRTLWMEHGRVRAQGKPDEIVAEYVSLMVARGNRDALEEAEAEPLDVPLDLSLSATALAKIPEFLTSIPNIDHRHGNGKARIQGMGVFSSAGSATSSAGQGDRICVRISVLFFEDVDEPNIGFMMRNRLGQDVAGTNAMFEGEKLPPARAQDRMSVDFVMDLPLLQGGYYHFSPAVADGSLHQYDMCDWIDNACAIEILQNTATHGHMRIPMRVRAAMFPREALKSS